jgi:transcriptional regulator with XRE-family HTH domain
MSPLGEELMFRRKQLGLSLEEMAKKIGYSKISRQILYQYESSRLVPTPEIFQRISKVYARDSADEKELWRLFWESRAVKLVHDEFDYVEGLFTITKSPPDSPPLPITIFILEGGAMMSHSRAWRYFYHRVKEFLLENNKKTASCLSLPIAT